MRDRCPGRDQIGADDLVCDRVSDGGAADVIASLWPIENTYASTYNRYFYAELITGTHPAVAHRSAINELRRVGTGAGGGTGSGEDNAHPALWAPFTHYGCPPTPMTNHAHDRASAHDGHRYVAALSALA